MPNVVDPDTTDTASSGLAVTFTAGGNCTVSGTTGTGDFDIGRAKNSLVVFTLSSSGGPGTTTTSAQFLVAISDFLFAKMTAGNGTDVTNVSTVTCTPMS